VAFVFKDLLLSRPNETHWQKLIPSHISKENDPISSHWRTSSEYYSSRPGITNRLEHTAVVDDRGSMYIWGGRFQSVSQIVGLWRLDVFTPDARLEYEEAPEDGIEQYEAELEALHMFIATMMFLSLTISSLFSMMRRHGANAEDGGHGGGRSLSRRRGLSRRVIDSLPLKRYEAAHAEVTEDGDGVEDVSLSRENSLGNESSSNNALEENLECCAICLVPYEDGVSEIRTLPCGHVFDRECIDAWFVDHTTCPSCRQNLGEVSIADEEEGGEDELPSGNSVVTRDANPRWRFHSHWNSAPLSTTDQDNESPSEPDAADTIREQYEPDPRWRFITAYESGRRRHDHWNDGISESPSTDGSSQTSAGDSDNEGAASDQDTRMNSAMPRFLDIRRFFSRRGHAGVMMVVPGEDDEEREVHTESIELV